jgi:hypothetical protein
MPRKTMHNSHGYVNAHWVYKHKNRGGKSFDAKENTTQFTWLCELLAKVKSKWSDSIHWYCQGRSISKGSVCFFTQGGFVCLGEGPPVLDFVFLISSHLGDRCDGVKVRCAMFKADRYLPSFVSFALAPITLYTSFDTRSMGKWWLSNTWYKRVTLRYWNWIIKHTRGNG